MIIMIIVIVIIITIIITVRTIMSLIRFSGHYVLKPIHFAPVFINYQTFFQLFFVNKYISSAL